MANLLGSLAGAAISKLFGLAAGTVAGTGLNSLAAALQNAAKSAGGSTTSGANNPLDSSAATPSRSDELWAAVDARKARKASESTLNTSTPYVQYPSRDEAMADARAYFEPQYNSAVLSRNQLASDQQKRLTQALAARGYASARGGHRQVGEGNITQSHAAALENLRNQYDTQIGRYAMELYSGRANDAYQRLNTLLADQNAKNQLALNRYGMDLNAGLQREQMQENRRSSDYNALWNLAMILADVGEE